MRDGGVANYRGTYSKDTLPTNLKDDECLVINLEDYFDSGSTHWVAIHNENEMQNILTFSVCGRQHSVPAPRRRIKKSRIILVCSKI